MSTGDNRALRGLALSLGFLTLAVCILLNVARNPLNDRHTQVDEQAHLSYALTLIHTESWWPDFSHFTMYDTTAEKPLSMVNYLNHAPSFYWLAKIAHAVDPTLTAIDYRYFSLALTIIGLALYCYLGYCLNLTLTGTAAYSFMPVLVYLHLQTGFYNNDSLAMLGGMLVALASLQWFRGDTRARVVWLAMIGLTFASVKLTAFLLVGFYAAACVMLNPRSAAMLPWRTRLASMLWLVVLLIPYIYFFIVWGSPAPETVGQVKLMTPPQPGTDWSRVLIDGWVHEPRMDFIHWFIRFMRDFAVQVSNGDTTFIVPLLLFICLGRSLFTTQHPPHTTLARMLRACLIATSMTFCIHAAFAWARYEHYGWRLDSNLRYYFPLLALYGAACAEAISHIGHTRPASARHG
jgi:hypothetical protein